MIDEEDSFSSKQSKIVELVEPASNHQRGRPKSKSNTPRNTGACKSLTLIIHLTFGGRSLGPDEKHLVYYVENNKGQASKA